MPILKPNCSRPLLAAVAGFTALLAAQPVRAQNPETSPRERLVADAEFEPGPLPVSEWGASLSNGEAGALLMEMRQLAEQALAASRAGEQAASIPEIKAAAERVQEAIWGVPSDMAADGTGDVRVHGWKTYWQVTGAEFDPEWIERYGTDAPAITDPRQLGIAGRGRAVRGRLLAMAGNERTPAERKLATLRTMAALNNLVGWTYITTGFKVKEVQPRISLTYMWDAPSEFWQSSADTGWLEEAYSQAVNILKTDYNGDVAEARKHAAGMTALLAKAMAGADANNDGVVEAKMMEGGLAAALSEAGRVGFQLSQQSLNVTN